MGVDKAREHPAARGVDNLVAPRRLDVRGDLRDAVALQRHVGAANTVRLHAGAALDDDHEVHPPLLLLLRSRLLRHHGAGKVRPGRAQVFRHVDVEQLDLAHRIDHLHGKLLRTDDRRPTVTAL